MAFFHEFQKRVRAALWPVAGALMVAYFGYHLVQGNQGLRAWHALDIKIAEAKETRDALAARRALIEGRVAALRPESLDPDMLTERARALLNLGHVHDVVIADIEYRPMLPILDSVMRATTVN